jgi:replicative DNA helicase
MKYAEKRGKIERDENNVVINYKPHNPNLITLIIIDHISLIDKNSRKDKTKKDAIDRASKMLVFFRNNFRFSPVVVSQFNRGIEGMDRKQQDSQEPQLSDFKDTGATQEDANTVVALFNPFRYGIDNHRGYPILDGEYPLRRNYRSGHILKNRDGLDSAAIGFHFLGAVGKFEELPKASEIKADPELLKKVLAKHQV